MYLKKPLDQFEYMRMHFRDIPQEIIDQYKLTNLVAPNLFFSLITVTVNR